MVLNLNSSLTEEKLNQDLTDRRQAELVRPGYQLPAPLVNEVPLDEIGKKERLFAMAFLSLYPYGRGDLLRRSTAYGYPRRIWETYASTRWQSQPLWTTSTLPLLVVEYTSTGSNS